MQLLIIQLLYNCQQTKTFGGCLGFECALAPIIVQEYTGKFMISQAHKLPEGSDYSLPGYRAPRLPKENTVKSVCRITEPKIKKYILNTEKVLVICQEFDSAFSVFSSYVFIFVL